MDFMSLVQVKIRELGSKVEYSVPVTSTLEFGLVYNPYHGDIKDALRGFLYPTVADVLELKEKAPLPKLITVTTSSSHTTPGDQVTKGEFLLVKEAQSRPSLGYRQLHVFSLTTKTDKFLHETCGGNFTTKPEVIKFSLFSIIKYLPHVLPLCIKIFPGPDLELGDEHYPAHLFEKVVQICRTFTDVLLVASSVPQDSVCDGREPFEIPQVTTVPYTTLPCVGTLLVDSVILSNNSEFTVLMSVKITPHILSQLPHDLFWPPKPMLV